MNFLLIVHALAALFTVVFAVYTGFHLFHKSSIQHRADKIKSRMMPLIVGKMPKNKVMETLKKEFPEQELIEIYNDIISKQSSGKNR
jgi:hypothetical protein